MSAVSKFAGQVAGVVSVVAAFIPGGQPIALIAAGVAAAANVTAQLTAAKPAAKNGSVNKTTIGSNQPRPYLIGETYYGGNRIHEEGFGGKVGGVHNPYRLMIDTYSCAGPLEGFVAPYLDFVEVPLNGDAATGYAANHLWVYRQLGQMPEPAALPTRWGGAQGWGADYRLSSFAAISWNLRFDEDGKRFAAGVPQTGAIWRGVKCYDPRKDSTYPGGDGPQRWADPADTAAFDAARATWTYTRCPGLHGLRYALGTWERDPRVAGSTYRKTFGIGIPADGIRVADFVALANVCDANGWHVDGVIHEPGSRDANLKDILAAGGAERCWVGGRLGLKISAPRVPLDTITEYDLATDDVEVGAMQGWESRLNTIVPKYRSRDHKWEYVPSKPVTIGLFVTEDGEEKSAERQWNLVQDKDQVAQLAAYELYDARELGEIVLTCKPRVRRYGAGDLLIVDLPDDGLVQQPCVILKRTIDPVRMTVELVLRGETTAKHDFALGRTGIAPPISRLVAGEVLDGVAADLPLDWDVVFGPGKPDDNATNSRDLESPFGPDGKVRDVLDQVAQMPGLRDAIAIITDTPDLDEMVDGAQRLRDRGRQLAATQLADQLAAVALGKRTDALTHIDGLPVGPVVRRVDRERLEGDEALAESLTIVKADGERTAGFLDAEVLRLDRARIDSDQAEAMALQNTRAHLDSDIDAAEQTALGQVTRLDRAIADAEGAQASALQDTAAEFAAAIDDVERTALGQITRLDHAVADATAASATAIAKVEADVTGEASRSRSEIARVDDAIATVDRSSAEAVARLAAELGDDIAGEVLRLDSVIAEEGRVRAEALQTVSAETLVGIDEAEARFAGDVMRLDTAIADQSGAVARALADVRAEMAGSGDDQLARLSAAVTRLDEAIVDANGARAQAVASVQAEVDGQSSSVEFLMRAVDGREAVAQLITRVDGTIAGFKINGRTYDFAVFAKRFTITDDETGKTYFYVDSERGAILEDVEVNRVRAGSINAEALVRGAAGLIHYCRVAGDVACPRGTSTMIVAFEVTKVDDDSDLKVQAYLHCHSPDDIDFLVQIIVDGVAQQTAEYRLPFDNANSRGKLTLTPFDYLSGIPAGQHTVTVALTNIGPSTPLTIKARSVLEVTELRAGVAAMAVPSTVPAGGGSSGGGDTGGGDAGGGSSGGGGTKQPVNQS